MRTERDPLRIVAGFQVAVGALIAGMWLVLLVTGQVPEVDEGRTDIWFHLVAELGTAALLIGAGVALRRQRDAARLWSAVALGALAYTVVNSPGHFAEAGDRAAVALFGLLGLATLAVVRLLVHGHLAATSADSTTSVPVSTSATPVSTTLEPRPGAGEVDEDRQG